MSELPDPFKSHFSKIETKWEKILRLLAFQFGDDPTQIRKKYEVQIQQPPRKQS